MVRKLLLCGVVFLSGLVMENAGFASVPIQGNMTAVEACPAYQSSRKLTNPGEVHLDPLSNYAAIAMNEREDGLWIRLSVPGASPAERWVRMSCGVLLFSTVPGSGGSGGASGGGAGELCHTAGAADSYVLALSWQPAFCEAKPDKPECSVVDPSAYQASHLTLHGLWPNRDACPGSPHFEFCGEQHAQVRPFCDYPPVPSLDDETRRALWRVMPSSNPAHSSCLDRHEWHKHGTCQVAWDADGYFDRAMSLLATVDASPVGEILRANVGGAVQTSAFFDAVDAAFGPGARDRVQIKCKGGDLVDLWLHLPAALPETTPLPGLLLDGPPRGGNGCGAAFQVDRIDD